MTAAESFFACIYILNAAKVNNNNTGLQLWIIIVSVYQVEEASSIVHLVHSLENQKHAWAAQFIVSQETKHAETVFIEPVEVALFATMWLWKTEQLVRISIGLIKKANVYTRFCCFSSLSLGDRSSSSALWKSQGQVSKELESPVLLSRK